jgi:hypothetical protein
VDFNDIEQRLVEPTVGAVNRSNEFERFNVNTEAAVATLAGAEVNLGVRLITVSPLTGRHHRVVALPFWLEYMHTPNRMATAFMRSPVAFMGLAVLPLQLSAATVPPVHLTSEFPPMETALIDGDIGFQVQT